MTAAALLGAGQALLGLHAWFAFRSRRPRTAAALLLLLVALAAI